MVCPLPLTLRTPLPLIVAPVSADRCESAVTVQLQDESSATVADLAVFAVLTAPVSVEPLVRVSVTELIWSATTAPDSACALAVSSTCPPLEPVVPHCAAAALTSTPPAAVTFTPDSLTTPVELVTKNSGLSPAVLASEPPVWV